ncbi:MAG: hypothetical protein JXR77_16030 [Lentisphaeria bacterium]|nr:hypothetical protein [Lentisphaeria bacterium]
MRRQVWVLIAICVAAALLAGGCAGPKVDEKKPLAEIETEAEKMSADDLFRMAKAYGKAILEKREQVDDLRDRLADIEDAELVSSEVTKIRTDADAVATSVAALMERFDLYVRLLKEKGGEASGLSLD